MILSFISQKGGVGKSSLARLVAVEMAGASWNLKICDLDPAQGTSTRWKARRDRANIMPDIEVQKFRNVNRALGEASRFDLLILDGPAHAEKSGITMAKASDLVILPTSHSVDDMEPQIETAFELEKAGTPADKIRFVFCRSKGSEFEDRDARDYLRGARVHALPGALGELQSIRQAHASGRTAAETSHPGVRKNARAVAMEIIKALGAAQ